MTDSATRVFAATDPSSGRPFTTTEQPSDDIANAVSGHMIAHGIALSAPGFWWACKLYQEAVKQERERCAQVCEDYAINESFNGDPEHEEAAYLCAAAIRSRTAVPAKE